MKLKIKNQIASEIENFYFSLLHRHARKSDLITYLQKLEEGKIHISDLPAIIKNSEEFKMVDNLKKIKNGPIKTKDGITMYLQKNDYAISGALALYKIWEPLETKTIKKYLKKPTNFIDIGAHIGYYSLLGASISKKSKVFAFEPIKENIRVFKKNVNANHFKNITIFPYAVSNMNGKTKLYPSTEANTGDFRSFDDDLLEINEHRKGITVESIALDDFLINNEMIPDVIKIDIQGGEMIALKGMKKKLAEAKKLALFTEFWPRGIISSGESPKIFLRSLTDLGFEIYDINEKKKIIEKKSNEKLLEENMNKLNPDLHTDLLCLKNIDFKFKNLPA